MVCLGVGEGPILFQSDEKWLLFFFFSERHPIRINMLLIGIKGRAIMVIMIFITANSCPALTLTQTVFFQLMVTLSLTKAQGDLRGHHCTSQIRGLKAQS